MTTLQTALEIRREEFDAHFALAHALEDRMMLEVDASLGTVTLSARHINTVKSGLVVHLYNIEEAIMNQVLQHLGTPLAPLIRDGGRNTLCASGYAKASLVALPKGTRTADLRQFIRHRPYC